MEALIYDREMEMGSEWQLFGGQLRDLSVQSTFADLQGHVLQSSWPDDSLDDLVYQRSNGSFLEDSALHYPADVIDSKHASSLRIQEGPSLYDDDLCDLLSSSPEEAYLPVDDDSAEVDVASKVDSNFSVIVSSYGGSSGLVEAKFDYGNIQSGQQYLISPVPQNLYENQKIQNEISHDVIEFNKSIRTDSFAFDHGSALDSFHYENHCKPAADLDGIEGADDSLLDAESVCMILEQLVSNHSDHRSSRPDLFSVSPEEVESVLLDDVAQRDVEDYDSSLVPCSPPVSNLGFLPFAEISPISAAILTSEYSQDSLSSTSSINHNHTSSPCIPYSVETRTDRRLKKKEQNKTAALRYRNKKREEKGVVYSEVEELEQKNAKLQSRADDLTKEINYLKSLLEEIKRQS